MAGYFEQNDPVNFSPQLSLLFPRTGLKLEGLVSQGKISAVLSKTVHGKLSIDNKLVVDKYVLNMASARTHAGIFQRQAERGSIPWILGPASLIPGIGAAITIATSTIDGLYRLAESALVTASQLVVLMADGGAFVKTWSLEKHAQHGELLVTMVFYSVIVGTENRMHGIYSSKHAMLVRD
jgi:hypothetical protein